MIDTLDWLFGSCLNGSSCVVVDGMNDRDLLAELKAAFSTIAIEPAQIQARKPTAHRATPPHHTPHPHPHHTHTTLTPRPHHTHATPTLYGPITADNHPCDRLVTSAALTCEQAILQLVAALLHLGNVRYEVDGEGSTVDAGSASAMDRAAKFLGVQASYAYLVDLPDATPIL
jgi:hypothetical protein